MSTVRLRRLNADFTKLKEYVLRHPRVRLLQTEGDPPERYQLEYCINSIRMSNDEIHPVKNHLVEIYLPRNYPRTPPQCRMLSPVFHPNISPHAICVGDHWSSGEPLQSIVIRIGELLAYQSYNTKSPLNGEAARWVEINQGKIPLDRVSLLVEDDKFVSANNATIKPAKYPPKQSQDSSFKVEDYANKVEEPIPNQMQRSSDAQRIVCPHCQKAYRLRAEAIGKTVKCLTCNQSFEARVS